MRELPQRIGYPHVVSTLALVVALTTGGAYAADKIGSKDIARNAVKAKHLAGKAVRSRAVAPGAIRSKHVRDGSLLGVDFAPGELPAGPPGQRGEKGEKGDPGEPGPPGLSGVTRVSATGPTDSSSGKSVTATCPDGKRVIGSGADIAGGKTGLSPNHFTQVAIDEIYPADTSVTVDAYEIGAGTTETWRVTAWAICAFVTP